MMQQTSRKTVATLWRYIREGSLFRENAAAVVGLKLFHSQTLTTMREPACWLAHANVRTL